MREHSIKNGMQHYQTLKQFQNRQDEYEEFIEWFKTLPLYYESDLFRVVHASWDYENIARIREMSDYRRLTGDLLYESAKKGRLCMTL